MISPFLCLWKSIFNVTNIKKREGAMKQQENTQK